MQDNRGKRPSPISMDKAFAIRSTHGSAMRCGACHFWSCGWCSIKASMTSEQAFACNYGSRKREAVRTSIKGMKAYESKRKKPISSPDRVEWPKKPKTRRQERRSR